MIYQIYSKLHGSYGLFCGRLVIQHATRGSNGITKRLSGRNYVLLVIILLTQRFHKSPKYDLTYFSPSEVQ